MYRSWQTYTKVSLQAGLCVGYIDGFYDYSDGDSSEFDGYYITPAAGVFYSLTDNISLSVKARLHQYIRQGL